MAKKGHTVSYTPEELAKLKTSEGTQSDWSAAAAMTPAQIEANIAADPDEEGMVMDWENASVTLPEAKSVLNMRVDRDVLDYFRNTGRGYQTRINAVLRSYVEQMGRR
jgi:uncharacterized protein (DUF4415 family)